jgi:hypothetical protein
VEVRNLWIRVSPQDPTTGGRRGPFLLCRGALLSHFLSLPPPDRLPTLSDPKAAKVPLLLEQVGHAAAVCQFLLQTAAQGHPVACGCWLGAGGVSLEHAIAPFTRWRGASQSHAKATSSRLHVGMGMGMGCVVNPIFVWSRHV